MERVAMTRLTFEPGAWLPIWSPDGQRIIYTSVRNDRQGLYAKLASGEGNEELIFLGDKSIQVGATDCTRDGRFVLFHTVQAGPTKADVWLLPMQGDRKPVSFLQTEFAEFDARLSPDGKWITYTSNESGRFEIYVRRFTAGAARGAKWLISTHGGRWPAWRRDGKEMFYFGLDGKIMAVPVSARGESTNTTFVPGVPKALFDTGKWQCPSATPFIPAADGQRFLVIALTDDKPQSVNVVVDWAATP
jgi:Tol biopolymer transport system component